MAFFRRRLIETALPTFTQLQNHAHPSPFLTRGLCQADMSPAAMEAAAERRRRKNENLMERPFRSHAMDAAEDRRRRKRELRMEPPPGAMRRRDEYARSQPLDAYAKMPDSITVLIDERLFFHNRIQSTCRAGKLDEAIQSVQNAFRSRRRPTVFTCNALMGHLQRAGRHADVISTFKFITQAGVIPNVCTYNTLIATHCANLDMEEAFRVLKTFCACEFVRPNLVTYNHLMSAQFKLKNYDGVIVLFREMLEKCYEADPPTNASTIEGFVNGGSMDYATELYLEMKKRGSIFSEPVFCNMIRGYFVAGRVSEAMEVFEFVPEKVERTFLSYNAVLKGMCATGRVKEAEDFFAKMVSGDVRPNADSYAILMGGLIGEGKLDEAVRISQAYRSSSEDLSQGAVVYDVLLDGLFKAGRVLECEEIVAEMAEKHCEPSEVSYNLLIDGFCRDGRIEECLRSFRRLLDAKFSPGLGVCSKLFAYLCDVGKLDEVRELFEGMVDLGLVPDVTMYDVLIGGFGKEGREGEVRRVFQNVLDKGVASEELVARIGRQTEEPNLGLIGEETKSEVAAAM